MVTLYTVYFHVENSKKVI